ncbi:MAG TPA: 1-aminocyclopropane-1-carboxylate deaminase [Clostridiales bacterium]|nr:1-aminocyclopropane-1-carboxylate deaminase [Clostridiales bacterium]
MTTTPILPLNYTDHSNRFYIKRDDLIPFSFGGNKVRIAHEYFKDMKLKGFNSVISYGNSRSNLNRVIANMGRALDIPCFIVSPADDSGERIDTSNSRIVEQMGAEIITCTRDNVADTIEAVMNDCKDKRLNPYYIYGNKYGKGNEKTAVQAYVKAYEEILHYEGEYNVHFDYIFHASGTGATQAGLICGKLKNNDSKDIVGISIARSQERGKAYILNNIVTSLNDSCFAGIDSSSESIDSEIIFTDKYICGGYGKYSAEIINMIRLVLSLDGIPLDRTYTGKAFLGMTEYVKEKDIGNAKILFIHTGGTPLFFDDLLTEER